jgi:hypothetical protein
MRSNVEESPEQIAADIVNRFAWTTNVMDKGMMVSQQVVAATIRNAIEKERAQYKIVLDSYAAENQRFSDENERLRAALVDARDGLRNDFEPDNQSRAWHRANDALKTSA